MNFFRHLATSSSACAVLITTILFPAVSFGQVHRSVDPSEWVLAENSRPRCGEPSISVTGGECGEKQRCCHQSKKCGNKSQNCEGAKDRGNKCEKWRNGNSGGCGKWDKNTNGNNNPDSYSAVRQRVGSACKPCPQKQAVSPEDQKLTRWLENAIKSHPETKAQLDAWAKISGEQPTLEIKLGSQTPPSREATFPMGLTSGRGIQVKISGLSGDGCPKVSSQLAESVKDAFTVIAGDYYRLGVAFLKDSLLKKRQLSLEELREYNRDAANVGQTSWTEVVYLDSLLAGIHDERSANQLDLDVLTWNFEGAPMTSELRTGRIHVWGNDDFWKFYPKYPPAEGHAAADKIKAYSSQFKSLMNMVEAARDRRTMSTLYDQVSSEVEGGEGDMDAAEEIRAAAKIQEANARLAYLEALLTLPAPVTVAVEKTPQIKEEAAQNQVVAAEAPSCEGGSGKVFGIFLVLAGAAYVIYTSLTKSSTEDNPGEPGGGTKVSESTSRGDGGAA